MTAHASDARTQKRSSLKGNRDTRRARLPRQQPPGRHGIVSQIEIRKEPAMLRIKAGLKKPSAPRPATRATARKAARPAARKSRPRHGTSSRVRIAHIMGDERTTRRPRARERRLLPSSSSTDATGKIRITRPSITSLPARCSTDLRSRETAIDTQDEKASDHPARHTPGPPLTRRSDTRQLDRRRVEDRRWQPPRSRPR